MKKIKPRRKYFRINSPMSFGILCGVLLLAIGGAAFGLAAGVIAPAIDAAKKPVVEMNLPDVLPDVEETPVPEGSDIIADEQGGNAEQTPEPTVTPEPTATPEPKPTPTPVVSEDQGAVKRLSGHTIAIDAAKGKGAKYKGVSTKTPEYKTNLKMAEAVKDLLEKQGATVIMTRTDDTFVKNDRRYKMVNASDAELCVTIMCNHVGSGSIRGTFAIIPSSSKQKTANNALAKAVLSAYMKETEMPLRDEGKDGIRTSKDWETLNGMKVPCCAIILGHISNKTDDKLLSESTYIARGAQGIADGIEAYLSTKK